MPKDPRETNPRYNLDLRKGRLPAVQVPRGLCGICKESKSSGIVFTDIIITIDEPLLPQINETQFYGKVIMCTDCVEKALERTERVRQREIQI